LILDSIILAILPTGKVRPAALEQFDLTDPWGSVDFLPRDPFAEGIFNLSPDLILY